MKTVMYFLLTVLTALLACHKPADNDSVQNRTNHGKAITRSDTCQLSLADAEKILGQPAKLSGRSAENKNGVAKFRCTYTANTTDTKTNKRGNVYYLLEDYGNVSSSQKAYSDILSQNENMPGLKKLNGTGDQAFLHTDNKNFVMIISRKGKKILRLKVNKLTSMTSVGELENISKTIAATL